MPETLTITLQDLQKAFEAWERDYRAGLTLSHEESSQMPVEELAKVAAESFWGRLQHCRAAA